MKMKIYLIFFSSARFHNMRIGGDLDGGEMERRGEERRENEYLNPDEIV